MKKMKKTLYILAISTLLVTLIPSCADNNETPPPVVEFTSGEIVTVQQVKALYDDQLALDYKERVPVEITSDWALKGIITASDKKDGNLYKEAYIQDATGGLRMVFESTSGLYIGDSVIVNVKGLFLGDYGDFWQLGSVPYSEEDGDIRVSGMNMDKQVLKLSVDNPTYPEIATITQIKTAAYLGKLVKLENVQFTDDMNGLTWADAKTLTTMNRDLEDCSSKSVVVRTSGYSAKAGDLLPTGKGSIVGIVTIYAGTTQFIVRDFDEVSMTGDRCGYVPQPLGSPVETLSQNFTGFTAEQTIYVPGWQNLAQAGGRTWLAKLFSGNTYAQATAYKSTATSTISWFITNPVTISTQKILSFQSAMAFWNHAVTDTPLEVYYSTDYDGTNLNTANWVKLSPTLATSTSLPNYTFINSGNVNLPVESGKSAVIAFKYTGSNTKTTSICIDNIVVSAAK